MLITLKNKIKYKRFQLIFMEEGYDLKSKLKILGVRERAIAFIKSTSIYKQWPKWNYYLYKYIDNFIINVKREKKTNDIRNQNHYYFLSAFFAFINYPLYRIFFEYSIKALNPKNIIAIYPNFTQIRWDIRKNSKLYAGFGGFLTGYMVTLSSFYFDKYFNPQKGIYLFAFYHLLSLSLAYPYVLNSNYKILKSPKFISFKYHPFQYAQLMLNKQYYFGYRDWFIMNCLVCIPFLNLKAYKYESFRICRIAAHMFEKGESHLKEVEKNFILRPTNHTHYGKFLFNFYPVVFNVYCIFQIWLLICFYDRAGNFVNLWRKDDATRYREAMETKYPRKPNEWYLDLWGPFLEEYKYERKEEKMMTFDYDYDEDEDNDDDDF